LLRQYPGEPWRQWVHLMLARVPEPGEPRPMEWSYGRAEELANDLEFLADTLQQAGAAAIAVAEVAPMRRLAAVYGFHAAALDIRQNSAFHGVAIGQLLTIAGMDGADYLNWPEHRKRELIDRELSCPRPFAVSSAGLPPEA